MAEEDNQIELMDEAADLAPFDPTKKKKKNKVVIQDPAEDSVEQLADKTENLSVSENLEPTFTGLKKKKKKPVQTDLLDDEKENAEEDVDYPIGEYEVAEGIELQEQKLPWEKTDRDYKYEEGGSFQSLLGFGDFSQMRPFDVSGSQEEVVPETRPHYVPETQPKRKLQRKHRKKQDDAGPYEPVSKKKWTPEEELALAVSWASTSEDPIIGRNRNILLFWQHVRSKFFKKMTATDPEYHRSNDMISSKWRDLSNKVKKFDGILRQKDEIVEMV